MPSSEFSITEKKDSPIGGALPPFIPEVEDAKKRLAGLKD